MTELNWLTALAACSSLMLFLRNVSDTRQASDQMLNVYEQLLRQSRADAARTEAATDPKPKQPPGPATQP